MSIGAETVHDFTSQANGGDYRLKIWRPPTSPPAGGFPVLWVLDGSAYFGLTTDMVRSRSVFANEITAAVVVGVTYPLDDLPVLMARRSQDFTPTVGDGTSAFANAPGASFGGLDGFLDTLEHEAFAAVAKQVPIDRDRMSILGHSFGGLAVLHALFTRPTMFSAWLALSPSIWWDGCVVLRGEAGFADAVRRGEIAPRVFIGVGSSEQTPPDRLPPDAPFTLAQAQDLNARARMIDNAAELAARLGALAGSPDYTARYLLAQDESHMSLPFAAARAALDLALAPPDASSSSPDSARSDLESVTAKLDALFAPFACDDGARPGGRRRA